jgi:ribosomal protein S18 acetylase RimI-like enzyme
MTPVVFLEADPIRKRRLQERLTGLLPQWFAQPVANAAYALQAKSLDGYVGAIDREECGLLLLKRHGALSAEIYWLGVDPKFHRRGIGRSLVAAASGAAGDDGIRFLFVATLHPDDPYEPYRYTRDFYEALGFVYVLEEQFPATPDNRLAYYMKDIGQIRA